MSRLEVPGLYNTTPGVLAIEMDCTGRIGIFDNNRCTISVF